MSIADEVNFQNDAAYLVMTEKLADLAEVYVGEGMAPTLLLAAALKALSRTMRREDVISQARVWLESIAGAEGFAPLYN